MTPEQIREEAIEAAEAALRRAMNSGLSIEFAFPAAINAYEKAMKDHGYFWGEDDAAGAY
jgi:ribosomal protein L16/L10AE